MTISQATIDSIIRIALIALIVVWSAMFVAPFVGILLWGIIIAVSAYPAFLWLAGKLGDRAGLAATILVRLILVIIIGPIAGSVPGLTDSVRNLAEQIQSGSLAIPDASESVKAWPLVDERLFLLWQQAATNLTELLTRYQPQLREASVSALSSIAAAGLAVLQIIASVIIAGVILTHHTGAAAFANQLAQRIVPESRDRYVTLTENTVRGVTMGVIGVAIAQAILAGIGFAIMGIPGAALWALICLVLAILQISMAIVIIPIIVYAFSSHELLPSMLFLAWNTPVLALDNVLKPILMGRGVDAPMLVIFIGAIGGFISFGFLGLFFGAVVLVIAYNLLVAWTREISAEATQVSP